MNCTSTLECMPIVDHRPVSMDDYITVKSAFYDPFSDVKTFCFYLYIHFVLFISKIIFQAHNNGYFKQA